MKILIADDDATLRNELAGLLREEGHEVVGASDGGEALRLIERESFDAALLDLKMPKASGMDVLHRLRVARPETAVVVITGQGTIGAAVEAMKAGAIDRPSGDGRCRDYGPGDDRCRGRGDESRRHRLRREAV